ncbi:hypothetical protein [Candidatus Rhabdochlamydia sp. T3358]|uniref:hypothetical protein n=1 Tax=Candidatus Rhabdochlamydia sp. T3358 TaxID=2099795 RepID=UPI0010BC5012|nr:hypothetical protein [Candidatus Rhabdochlamydia sp. T3358]VHO03673.1 hypothetical protein RHT_01021 [Candidatus Rhabdochlamydia sp. T3358]
MKLFFTCGVMFSFLFGCASLGYQSPRYVKLAAEITEKTAQKLKGKKNLYLIGTGGGMMNDIQMMAMSFDYYQEVDLKKARELLVYAVNEYLLDINNNEEIRPYLHEVPFTAKNVEIRIWVWKMDRSKPSPEKIYYISAIDGILNYYIRGLEEYSRQAICEETYEEALQAISFQK